MHGLGKVRLLVGLLAIFGVLFGVDVRGSEPDDRWTGLVAYYAYTSFCKVAGLEPITLDPANKRTISPYRGSLYRYAKATKAHRADVLDYWLPSSVLDLVDQHGITDLILVNGAITANAKGHVGQLEDLLDGNGGREASDDAQPSTEHTSD